MSDTFTKIVALVEANEVRISEHGYDEIVDDDITVKDVLDSVKSGTVVEDYPDYPKGPCVLVLQFDSKKQPMHVVWGIPKGFEEPAVLVTAYRPDPSLWDETFTERSK